MRHADRRLRQPTDDRRCLVYIFWMDEFEHIEPSHTSIDPEPPVFEAARLQADTPMGQVEMHGSFARSIGAKRMRVILGITAMIVLAIAVLSVL